MLIPNRPSIVINNKINSDKFLRRNVQLFRYESIHINTYYLGTNYNMIRYTYNSPSLRLLCTLVREPILIIIKGDLSPLAKALNWVNWKDSWLSWHINQNTQITKLNNTEPYLIITKTTINLAYGNSKEHIPIIEHVNGISNNLIDGCALAVLGAQLVWQSHLNSITFN